MALTVLNSPSYKITPAYNPSWFVLESTNSGQDNFSYVFDLYESTGSTLSTERLIRVRVAPDPVYGKGIYNSQKIVQNFVTPIFNPDIIGVQPQRKLEYSLYGGESYTFHWNFIDNQYFTGYTHTLGFTGNTVHYFNVGDSINIVQSGVPTNPEYDGVCEVIGVPNSYSIVVNKPFGTSTPPEGGVATLFNDAITTFSGLTLNTRMVGNNAAINNIDYITYSATTYYPFTAATGSFYTDAPDPFKIRLTNRASVTLLVDTTLILTFAYGFLDNIRIETTEEDGSTDNYSFPFNTNTGYTGFSGITYVSDVGLGCWNITNNPDVVGVGGSVLPVFKPTTVSYKCWVENTGSTRMTEYINFSIYDYCNKWDNYEFLFMDRKGCWMPFNFELVQRKTVDVKRSTYKRGLGTFDGINNMNYNSYDRGTTIINNTLNEKYTVTSNWLTEAQSIYFEQLLTSPQVYWNIDGTGTFAGVNLIKLSEEIKNKKNSRLIQYTLEFTLANNSILQTGV